MLSDYDQVVIAYRGIDAKTSRFVYEAVSLKLRPTEKLAELEHHSASMRDCRHLAVQN
jgi:hypothetical protein